MYKRSQKQDPLDCSHAPSHFLSFWPHAPYIRSFSRWGGHYLVLLIAWWLGHPSRVETWVWIHSSWRRLQTQVSHLGWSTRLLHIKVSPAHFFPGLHIDLLLYLRGVGSCSYASDDTSLAALTQASECGSSNWPHFLLASCRHLHAQIF